MKIYLVRHGMSRANVDWSENRRVADHAIDLTSEGQRQARECGRFLAEHFTEMASPTKKLVDVPGAIIPRIRLWHSPYRRTRQTAQGIYETCLLPPGAEAVHRRGDSMHNLNASDSFFLDKKEHFLLHEQQFGIFDGLSDEERAEQYPAETEHYLKCKKFEGKVWAKLPMGESRIDVARRMHQAFGTFKRDEEKHGIDHIVVVGHGTTNRCFTMAWLHLPPEWLEKEPNPRNCSVRLIEDGEDKGYIFDGFENPPGYEHKVNKESEE